LRRFHFGTSRMLWSDAIRELMVPPVKPQRKISFGRKGGDTDNMRNKNGEVGS
jgi:hypothetical protein